MPINFICDQCNATSDSPSGWYSITTEFFWEDPSKPTPPGGKTTMGTQTLIFEKRACLDAWAEQAGLTIPTGPVGSVNAAQ